LLLRRGDNEMVLGHGDFLQEMEEFKALPSSEQCRTLQNEIFREVQTVFCLLVIM